MTRSRPFWSVCPAIWVGLGLAAAPGSVWAQDRSAVLPEQATASWSWKFTASAYRDSDEGRARDLNLRAQQEDTTVWIGHYRDAKATEQARAGLERSVAVARGRLIVSMQWASGGFAGGGLTWDGRSEGATGWAPLLGLGRSNARPYVNLNFDPNDSVLFGASYVQPCLGTFTGFRVRDDRFGTGQTVDHLVWRRPLPGRMRLTVDLFARSGAASAGEPKWRGQGYSATLDVADVFVRLAHDPVANYTAATVDRLALGFRF